jgi:hypothetical protein
LPGARGHDSRAAITSLRRGELCLYVPKRDLAAAVVAALGSRRLRVASALPDAPMLLAELRKFRMKISDAGNDTNSAWRENDHDDWVLAVALALWRARRRTASFNGKRRESFKRCALAGTAPRITPQAMSGGVG